MNRQETTFLCRLVKSLCPAQAIDQYTPDAWYGVLGDYDFGAAQAAIRQLAQEKTFIAVADIVQVMDPSLDETPIPPQFERGDPDSRAEPNQDFIAARDNMIEKMKARDRQAMAESLRPPEAVFAEQDAGARAADHIDRHVGPSKYPNQVPADVAPLDRWVELPNDPPELRRWLAAQRRAREP